MENCLCRHITTSTTPCVLRPLRDLQGFRRCIHGGQGVGWGPDSRGCGAGWRHGRPGSGSSRSRRRSGGRVGARPGGGGRAGECRYLAWVPASRVCGIIVEPTLDALALFLSLMATVFGTRILSTCISYGNVAAGLDAQQLLALRTHRAAHRAAQVGYGFPGVPCAQLALTTGSGAQIPLTCVDAVLPSLDRKSIASAPAFHACNMTAHPAAHTGYG